MDNKIFIPGKITAYGFCTLFLLALFFGIFSSPLKAFSQTDIEQFSFKIGYPITFFELDPMDTEKIPILWKGLSLDFLVYFLVAYAFDILFKMIYYYLTKKSIKREETPRKTEIIRQAKRAYKYYREQGMSEENIFKLFQEKGWTEEDFVIYLKEVPVKK